MKVLYSTDVLWLNLILVKKMLIKWDLIVQTSEQGAESFILQGSQLLDGKGFNLSLVEHGEAELENSLHQVKKEIASILS